MKNTASCPFGSGERCLVLNKNFKSNASRRKNKEEIIEVS